MVWQPSGQDPGTVLWVQPSGRVPPGTVIAVTAAFQPDHASDGHGPGDRHGPRDGHGNGDGHGARDGRGRRRRGRQRLILGWLS